MLCEPESEGVGKEQIANLPEGVPLLTSLYLYVTSGCNLRCRHCWIAPSFVKEKPSPDEYLDLDLLRRAVTEAKPLGLRSVKLTGGEPTLHPQFVAIVDFLTAEDLKMNMETNGTLIDANLARHLKERTSVYFVSVSIDSPDAAAHDTFRGVAGSFDAAVGGFRHLVEAGYKPQLIMALHRGNAHQIEEIVKLAIELGAGSVKVNPVMRSGRAIAMHAHGEALDFEEVMQAARFVRGDLQRRTPIRLYLVTPPALYTVSELVHRGKDGMCHVRHILGILGSGEMALCGIGRVIPELCFGRLQDTSVTDVWFNHPTLHRLRQDLDGQFPGVCGQCIHARACLTHCVAHNYQHTGQLISPWWLCAEAYEQGLFPTTRLRRGNDPTS